MEALASDLWNTFHACPHQFADVLSDLPMSIPSCLRMRSRLAARTLSQCLDHTWSDADVSMSCRY
jgi:hypothetical protein